MATGLERRLKVLEDAGGGGECPRCSGIVATFVNGELHDASRYGKAISREEYFTLEAETGLNGECPVCGACPIDVKAGGSREEGGGGA